MPIRKVTDTYLGQITTSKLLSITNSETLYFLGSGNRSFEATNLGPYRIYYGASAVTLNSGGLINPNGSKAWDEVVDNFSLAFVLGTGGVTSQLIIQEYTGL